MAQLLADFDVIDDCLSIRCGRPLKMPKRFTQYGGVADPTNMFFRAAPEDALDLNGLVLAIKYSDVQGHESARIVRLRKAWSDNDIGYVHGYCELREEYRQFRISRISEIIDTHTGEIVKDAQRYFSDLGLKNSDKHLRAIWEDIRHGMCVLMALAVADEILLEDEIECVVRYADERAGDLGFILTDKEHRRIAQVARNMRPDLECAKAAMRYVVQDPQNAGSIARALRGLSQVDGVVCEIEHAFLSAIAQPSRPQ